VDVELTEGPYIEDTVIVPDPPLLDKLATDNGARAGAGEPVMTGR
jgi:hypothetical protein